MAIRRMTSADKAGLPNVETVTDYHGHETTRWTHGYDCPHYRDPGYPAKHDDCLPEHNTTGLRTGCHYMDPLYMETTHVGLVLATGERNGYDDSDFYATVWNPETKRPETVEYATTRGWTYPNHAWVDATPEVVAAYEAYRTAAATAAAADRAARNAKVPSKGTTVRVKSGRKVPKGTTGTVVWFGEDRFRRSAHDWPLDTLAKVELGAYRVGIDTPTGRVFTNARNVEVVTADRTD